MRTRRQIVNPEQQPWNRDYRRETRQYERDEQRDFARGADYLGRDFRGPMRREPRDYTPRNEFERQYRGQAPYAEGYYAPSRDYGYQRDEYYDRDPSRGSFRRGEAVGYGNDHSQQGRDFERWMHDGAEYRSFSARDFREHRFPSADRRPVNRDFAEGLFDPEIERGMHDGRYRRRHNRHQHQRRPDSHKYEGRTDRHPEIVRPFKDQEDYGRNDYNHSEGFGSHEMVYHDERYDDRRGEWVGRGHRRR